MVRMLLAAVVALVFSFGSAIADEVKGKFVKYDADKKVLTVSVDDKEKEFTLTEDTKLTRGDKPVKAGLMALSKVKEGAMITLETEKKDGKNVVTEVKLPGKKPPQ
jgi:hypothetical protein